MSAIFLGLFGKQPDYDTAETSALYAPMAETMRLYHFTTAEHGMEDVKKKRLKIAQLLDLNDPFELVAYDLHHPEYQVNVEPFRATFNSDHGFVCFSSGWDNVLMWSHYAEKHRGVCLGFDVTAVEEKFNAVHYSQKRLRLPSITEMNVAWMRRVLHTKSSDWKYEHEWRSFTDLTTPEWNEKAGRDLYFVDFGTDLVLREVLLGVNCPIRGEEVSVLCGTDVTVRRVRLSPHAYKLV